jgi:ribA/ribD-fused uncharacterized protein
VAGFDGGQVVDSADFVFFWQPPCVYSQWTPARFTVDGVGYGCAEQFMMAEKARLFGDHESRGRILATSSPKAQKALGRKVSGWDEALWDREKLAIVVAGNLAKFSQNPDMLALLLATGDKQLVEASPYDRVWGIGLRADDARVYDRSQWRGENLLGEALVQVRARLRSRPG